MSRVPPKGAKDRDFAATETNRELAKRELEMYLEALCHDQQFDIRRACYLLEIRALPKRLKREEQFQALEKALALEREKRGWGRPWTYWQIKRTFYAKPNFKRIRPSPVTREELRDYVVVKPPLALEPRPKA